MRKQETDTELYLLRKKYQRSGVTEVKGLNEEASKFLNEKKATPNELYILAEIYEFVGENIDREAPKYRTAKEWRELERRYVHRSDFTLPDLVDNLLRRLEKGRITREQLSQERRLYKACDHRFCLNYFRPRRKDQRFCCEDCRKRENDALAEFKKTSITYANGTYLPPTAYKEKRRHELEHEYRKHERKFDPEVLQLLSEEKELEPYELTGKRDKETEYRKNKAWEIEKEVNSVQKTTLNIEGYGESPLILWALSNQTKLKEDTKCETIPSA